MTDYSRKGHYYIDGPRNEVLRLSEVLKGHASVLDIGAGYGNNTKLLLQRGHRATALETNPEAVDALRQLAITNAGRLRVVAESIDRFKLEAQYDAVVCCMVLHFLESKRVGVRTVNDIQDWTKPGGYNVITSYLDVNSLSDDYSCLLRSGELRELYKDWEIVWYQESYARTLSNAKHPKDVLRLLRGQRGYKAARILAKKPA